MSSPISIILVDDHRLFRDGLRRLLASDTRFEVVGEASSGEEFLELAEELFSHSTQQPAFRLVFMDIDMPGIGGIETTRRALERWPDLRIIALSMHAQQEFQAPMMEAGAAGFLLKDSDFAQVTAAALRAVGENTQHDNTESLSEREMEVLPLICQGLSTQQIAERLFISRRTVDKHRANILAKTLCNNTASLVVYAVKNQLIKL